MKINEITRPPSLEDADRKLRNIGYKRLGIGGFGAAYQKRPDQVLKLFISDDIAYLSFIRLAKITNNPHFPRIVGNPIRVTDRYYAVKIEMLQEIDPNTAYNISSAVRKYVFALQRGKETTPDNPLYKIVQKYAPDFEQFDAACKILVELIQSDSDISLDIATRNIMFRNGVLVFSDPVASQTAMTNSNLSLDESDQSVIPDRIDGKPTRNSLGKLIHPTVEGIRNFWKWFGDSKVVDAQGRPLVVYHGTGNLENLAAFDPILTGKGNDQIGSGFYFTTDRTEASGYTGAITQNARAGERKLGGDTSPGVAPVYLKIARPIEVEGSNLTDTEIDLTPQQAFEIIKRVPNIRDLDESPLGDWIDVWSVGKITDKMLRDVAKNYAGPSLISLENDFFRSDAEAFRQALFDIIKRDGVTQNFDGKAHWVAWFPTQIKSAIGNNGDFSPNRKKISEGNKNANK